MAIATIVSAFVMAIGAGPALASEVVHEYTDHEGCVTLFTRHIEATETGTHWVELKAQMAGCARGHLHLHTYVNYEELLGTHLFHDGETNECENSTACEVPWTGRIYLEGWGDYINYAHGWNTTTGGSTYVTHLITYYGE